MPKYCTRVQKEKRIQETREKGFLALEPAQNKDKLGEAKL